MCTAMIQHERHTGMEWWTGLNQRAERGEFGGKHARKRRRVYVRWNWLIDLFECRVCRPSWTRRGWKQRIGHGLNKHREAKWLNHQMFSCSIRVVSELFNLVVWFQVWPNVVDIAWAERISGSILDRRTKAMEWKELPRWWPHFQGRCKE